MTDVEPFARLLSRELLDANLRDALLSLFSAGSASEADDRLHLAERLLHQNFEPLPRAGDAARPICRGLLLAPSWIQPSLVGLVSALITYGVDSELKRRIKYDVSRYAPWFEVQLISSESDGLSVDCSLVLAVLSRDDAELQELLLSEGLESDHSDDWRAEVLFNEYLAREDLFGKAPDGPTLTWRDFLPGAQGHLVSQQILSDLRERE